MTRGVLVYLDTNIVIYFVEQTPEWGDRTTARLVALTASGARLAVSDLTRMECRVGPLMHGDDEMLARFEAFFDGQEVDVLPVSRDVCERAAAIRARHRFASPDALHLAAALAGQCATFLTNDRRLAGFTEMAVEILA